MAGKADKVIERDLARLPARPRLALGDADESVEGLVGSDGYAVYAIVHPGVVVVMLGLLRIASVVSWTLTGSLCVEVEYLGGPRQHVVAGVAKVWWIGVPYCPQSGFGKAIHIPLDFNQGSTWSWFLEILDWVFRGMMHVLVSWWKWRKRTVGGLVWSDLQEVEITQEEEDGGQTRSGSKVERVWGARFLRGTLSH